MADTFERATNNKDTTVMIRNLSYEIATSWNLEIIMLGINGLAAYMQKASVNYTFYTRLAVYKFF